jgi:hypothetical protein
LSMDLTARESLAVCARLGHATFGRRNFDGQFGTSPYEKLKSMSLNGTDHQRVFNIKSIYSRSISTHMTVLLSPCCVPRTIVLCRLHYRSITLI